MTSRARPLLLHLAVYGFYLLVAAVVTYPLVAQLSTSLAGFVYGDAYEMAHHIWWFKHALQTGQTPFFQSLLAYPNGIEAVTLWANPLQSFPAWLLAFALPLPAAVNLQILLTLALNGWAMYFLARFLSRPTVKSPAPALIAGLVFMLYPTVQGHLGVAHLGQIAQWMMPLYVWALLRLRERGGWARVLLAGALLVLGAWGHTLQLITVLMPVTLVYLLMLLVRREWAALRRTILAVLLGGLLLGAFLLPIFWATVGTETYTGEGGAVRYSADLLGIVTPSFRHPLFGRLDYTHRVLGVNLDEGAAYLGMVAFVLALVALWKVKSSRWWLGVALLAWILSLGPLLKLFDQPVTFSVDGYSSYVTLPFALVGSLPLLNLARAPGRFNFAVALAVAVLVSYGAAYLWAWIRLNGVIKWAAALLLMVGIGFEYQTFFPLPTSPAVIPQAVSELANRQDVRAVLNLPWDSLLAAKYGMYLQTAHQHPLIAGHETRSTPVSPAKLTLLQATLNPPLLREAGADVVIIHREHDGDGVLLARARGRLGDPIYEDGQIALFNVPDDSSLSEASPGYTALLTEVETLTRRADSFVYAPEAGWVRFTASVTAEQPRELALLLDGIVARRWTADGDLSIDVPLPVNAGGFHSITLALEPECPANFDPALVCRAVDVANVTLSYKPAEAGDVISFEHGVTLVRALVPATARAGATLPVDLYWRFDQPRSESDVRFVHITNAAGGLVGQEDITLGTIAAGESRAERVEIALGDDLPPGEYSVRAGWYTYPEIVNFCVLAGGVCSTPAAQIGTFRIE